MKKRLIITAGTFTTVIAAALLRQFNEHNTENYLVSIGPTLYENVDAHIKKEAELLNCFKGVYFYFDYCAPKNKVKDEKSHILSFNAQMFKDAIGNVDFDEIISVYIHGAAHNLIKQYPKAKLYFMEDGIAAYLKMDNSEILDKYAKKIYTLNYFNKIKPHVTIHAGVKTQQINPTILAEVFNELASRLNINTGTCEKSVIFCAQNIALNSKAMPYKDELALYAKNIKKLLNLGYRVYFKEHPKTPNMFFKNLQPIIKSNEFISLGALNTQPVEILVPILKPDAIISMFSSALFTVPMLYDIPTFTFFSEKELVNHEIFLIGHLFAASYIPPIDMITGNPQETKELFNRFLKNTLPIEKQAIYNIKTFDYFKLFISRQTFNRTKRELKHSHKFLLKYANIDKEVLNIFESQTYFDYLLHYGEAFIKQYQKYSKRMSKAITARTLVEFIKDSIKTLIKLIF